MKLIFFILFSALNTQAQSKLLFPSPTDPTLIKQAQHSQWQLIQGVQDHQLVIVNEQIPEGPVGSPEEKSFSVVEKANFILKLDPSLKNFNSLEQSRIQYLSALYKNTTRRFYEGRNGLTETMQVRFSQDNNSSALYTSLDQIIRSEKFLDLNSFAGGLQFARVTDQTSLSPLKAIFGPGSRRLIFWPAFYGQPFDLSATRISAMVDQKGEVLAIEAIARDIVVADKSDLHTGWEPFVYEKRWGRWFPSTHVRNMPIENFCMRCHVSGDGRFSPYPKNVPDELTFKKIGFLNDRHIQEIMKFK